jgi:signal peptidase I
MSTNRPAARASFRALVETGIYVALTFLVLQTWLIDGLIAPCRVAGGSMADALLGEHRDVACADCGFRFFCDGTAERASDRAACPNCGYINSVESLPILRGDRVLIDRAAFHFRHPRRWEMAAFRHPRESGKTVLKRVVGLPGESVQILGGDIYIDGRIQRKTLEQQRRMAILVSDARCSPTVEPRLPPQWQGENAKTLWKAEGGRFTHPKAVLGAVKGPLPSPLPTNLRLAPGEGTIDWLVYHHWRRGLGRQDGAEQCPITDIMAYNQGIARREEDVHAVRDLMLCFDLVDTFGAGGFFVRATWGSDVYQLEIDPEAGTFRATCNGGEIAQENRGLPGNLKGLAIVVSLVDRQFLVGLGGRTVLACPIDDPAPESDAKAGPFAMGSNGLGVVVDEVRIYRDVYYTHPIGLRAGRGLDKPCRLADDEYYVLGDNSQIAEDSRLWEASAPVVDNLLIGKPLLILFRAKSARIGAWQFQVPDLSRIGYIR